MSGAAIREIQHLLSGRRLVVVSHRAPYARQRRGGEVRWLRAAGGLVSALDPVLQACRGLWISAGTLDEDPEGDLRDLVSLPPVEPQYVLQRVWLSESDVQGFYHGFSNSVLWPLCHLQMDKVHYQEVTWRRYREVNEKFASVVAESARTDDIIWWQDYHLALAPAFLRSRRPDLFQMHFWHIPWPPWDLFRTCPWREALLEGLLANDLLGFQLQRFGDNFINCASEALGVQTVEGEFHHRGQRGRVGAFPISIDFYEWERIAQSPSVEGHRHRLSAELPFEVIGIGVDRLDYTKGILERFVALERFYESSPPHRDRVGFVQVAIPTSRTHLDDYRRYWAKTEAQIDRINRRFRVRDYQPVRFLYRNLPREELVAYYRLADFAIVSSLQDGMNLVAKEFIACQVDRRGILICSEFAGAAEELESALIINPYDTDGFVHTLRQAIEMPAGERAQRMDRLRGHVARHHVFKWCADVLKAMLKWTALDLPRVPEVRLAQSLPRKVHAPSRPLLGPSKPASKPLRTPPWSSTTTGP